MGTVYPECNYGYKHVPDHAYLINRDPYTFNELRLGDIGVGQFLSLVPRSYAGFSLLTDDLIKIHGHDDCKCGRKGTYFKIIGRAKTAETRGCGDVIAEKIIQEEDFISNSDIPIILFKNSKKANDRLKNWDNVISDLKDAQEKLQALSIDDILLILKTAAKVWSSDDTLEKYKYHGLDFICNWIISGGFENNLNFSLRGSKHHLDDFIFHNEFHKKLFAIPRGICTHWLAGNVPTLGIISLLLINCM